MRTRRATAHLPGFAQSLLATAPPLYVDEPFGVDSKESVYVVDTMTIDLCLSVFTRAPLRSTKRHLSCARCTICDAFDSKIRKSPVADLSQQQLRLAGAHHQSLLVRTPASVYLQHIAERKQ